MVWSRTSPRPRQHILMPNGDFSPAYLLVTFFVTTRLQDAAGRIEQIFVLVDSIIGDRVTGWIASDLEQVVGFHKGQRYELLERDLLDWMILRPDGTEEGNVVGLFVQGFRPPNCGRP